MARRHVTSSLRLTKYLTSAAGFCIALFARDSSGQTFTTPPYTVPYQYAGATYNWIAQAQPSANTSYVFYCRDTEGEPTVDFNQQLGNATQFYLRFGGGYAWSSPGYCLLMHTDSAGSSWNLNIVVNGYFIFGTPEVNSFRQFRSHREFKYNGFPYDEYSNSNFGVSGIRTGDILIPGSSFSGGPLPPPVGFLSFPIQNRTAETAVINSYFDHSMGRPYAPDRIVQTYRGEQASGRGCRNPSYNNPTACTYGGLAYDGHPGYDYRTIDQRPDGSIPVFAAAGGRVRLASDSVNTLTVDHENGYRTKYLHMSERTSRWRVTEGEQIGTAGSVGSPGAPHLHFQVERFVGDKWIPVDPYGWTGCEGCDSYSTPSVRLWK